MDFIAILNTLTWLISAFVLFFIGKTVYGLFHRDIKINHVLLEEDNVAFAVSLTGYYAALICAIGAAIVGPSNGMVADLIDIFSYGLLAIVLLNISAIINDMLILTQFKIKKEILKDRNLGMGIIEGANYLSTGLIVYGSIVGEGGGYVTAIAFWAISQFIFFLASKAYNFILPYDIHKEIEKDNVAVGVGYAGALISIAYLIKTAVEHDFVSWYNHLADLGLDATIGFLFLPLARFLTDKILLPTRNLTDEIVNQEHPNVGAALIEAFAYIGGAILIGWTL